MTISSSFSSFCLILLVLLLLIEPETARPRHGEQAVVVPYQQNDG